jgi:hypothetical protein
MGEGLFRGGSGRGEMVRVVPGRRLSRESAVGIYATNSSVDIKYPAMIA